MRFKRQSSNVLQSDVEAGLALLDSESNTYFLLNRTGSVVWAELESAKTLDQLCDAVSEQFKISAADCKNDIEQLVDSMVLKGLVVAEDEKPV